MLWSVAALAAVFAAGCLNFPGLKNTWYVTVPFTAAFGLSIALLWQSGKVFLSRGRLKTFDHEKIGNAVSPVAGGLLLAAVLTAALSAVYLLRSGADNAALCVWYFALLAVAAAAAWMAGRAYQHQAWEQE